MKKISFYAIMFLSLSLLLAPTTVRADAPDLSITAPTSGTYYVSFPYVQPITFLLTAAELKKVQVLDVKVDGNSIFTDGQPIGNPFTNANGCSGQMILTNISYCSTNGSNSANVTAPWTVGAPGTYSIAISAKVTSDIGSDLEENISYLLVNMEHPAPPAEANAYIKTLGYKLNAGQRGCVISQIANNHAKESKYGPKGGPYEIDDIKADVDFYLGSCL